MNLVLWRHADAEDGAPDAERALTHRGREQAAETARWLKERLPGHYRLLVSPAVRAQQTAEALKRREFDTEPAVGLSATPASVLKAARWPDGDGTVVVVGHQPTLGCVAALLLSGTASDLSFKKSAVWWFSRRDDETVLRAVFDPRLG